MNFKRIDGDFGGGSLQSYPSDYWTREAVEKAFGKPDSDAYYEPERGYDGEEYTFVADTDPDQEEAFYVRLYTRWGLMRIGANNKFEASEFNVWLSSQEPL